MLAQLLGLEKRLFKKADAWGGKACKRAPLQAPPEHCRRRSRPSAPVSSASCLCICQRLPSPRAACFADLLVKETQRRNTFLLYAAAPNPAEAAAPSAAAPPKQQPQQRKPAGKRNAAQQGQQPSTQQQGSTQQLVVGYIVFTATGGCCAPRRGTVRRWAGGAAAAAMLDSKALLARLTHGLISISAQT